MRLEGSDKRSLGPGPEHGSTWRPGSHSGAQSRGVRDKICVYERCAGCQGHKQLRGGKLGIWEAWEKTVTLSSSEILKKT